MRGYCPEPRHSPCGRRERRVAFPSARAVCRSTPSRSGSIFSRWSKISTPTLDCVLALSNIVETCRGNGAKPSTVPRGGGGAGGTPCKRTCANHRTSAGGSGGTIGRRKRAVDALASTVPFFGVADELPEGGLSRGTWNTADRRSGRGYAVKAP